jgi:hypothetical protein
MGGDGVVAGVGDAFQQHPDVQRVPAGVAGERRGQAVRIGDVDRPADPARDILIGQPTEPDHAGRWQAHEIGECLGQRTVGVPVGADDQQPGPAQLTGQVGEQP